MNVLYRNMQSINYRNNTTFQYKLPCIINNNNKYNTNPKNYNHIVITYRKRIVTCATSMSIVEMSYYLGKGIILYTMFYCGLNYFMYKQMREEYEKDTDNDNKND